LKPDGQKLARLYLKNKLGAVVQTIILVTQEAEVRGLNCKANPGKSERSYLKNKLSVKGLGAWLK
jgi:hypothetical protein